jgi:hypothetical protein
LGRDVVGSGASVWERLTPYHTYGVRPTGAVPNRDVTIPGVERSAGPSMLDATDAPVWSPENPLFWFGALLLVTVGAAAASTQWRVGPVRVAVSAGRKAARS